MIINESTRSHPMFCTHFPDKLKPVFCNVPRVVVFTPYPDGIGKIRVISGECLNGKPTFVIDACQCRKSIIPRDMPIAGSSPVVLGVVVVSQYGRNCVYGPIKHFFVDVGGVGFKHGSYMRMIGHRDQTV